MTPGQRWLTRSGSLVTVTAVRDTGLPKYTLDWKRVGTAKLVIVQTDDGSTYAVHPDGHYFSYKDDACDLVRLAEAVAA